MVIFFFLLLRQPIDDDSYFLSFSLNKVLFLMLIPHFLRWIPPFLRLIFIFSGHKLFLSFLSLPMRYLQDISSFQASSFTSGMPPIPFEGTSGSQPSSQAGGHFLLSALSSHFDRTFSSVGLLLKLLSPAVQARWQQHKPAPWGLYLMKSCSAVGQWLYGFFPDPSLGPQGHTPHKQAVCLPDQLVLEGLVPMASRQHLGSCQVPGYSWLGLLCRLKESGPLCGSHHPPPVTADPLWWSILQHSMKAFLLCIPTPSRWQCLFRFSTGC